MSQAVQQFTELVRQAAAMTARAGGVDK